MNEGTLASKASYNWTRGAAANSGQEVWGVDHQSAVSAVRSLRFDRASSTERGTTGFDKRRAGRLVGPRPAAALALVFECRFAGAAANSVEQKVSDL
jgi:hypothetical protein